MKHVEVTRDDEGKPSHVYINDGFMQIHRAFNPETDGWMEDMLDPYDFPAIEIGRQTEALVREVNALRRELYMRRSP
jgi:hypothetical protein